MHESPEGKHTPSTFLVVGVEASHGAMFSLFSSVRARGVLPVVTPSTVPLSSRSTRDLRTRRREELRTWAEGARLWGM